MVKGNRTTTYLQRSGLYEILPAQSGDNRPCRTWQVASSLDERSGIEEISAKKPRFHVTPSRLVC